MKIILAPEAFDDLEYWKKTNNQFVLNKIKRLLQDILEHPYSGIGKPEYLKYDLSGKWSRRINSEHRIVYMVHDDEVELHVLSMRYHYKK